MYEDMGHISIHECQISYISCMKIWGHISYMKEEFSIFPVVQYGDIFHNESRISYFLCMKIWGHILYMKVEFFIYHV